VVEHGFLRNAVIVSDDAGKFAVGQHALCWVHAERLMEGAMRQSRFSDEQMVGIIREADRDPVAEVAKRHGISEQTIYTWRKRFGALRFILGPDGCQGNVRLEK
jgi:hypothetical protein